MRSMTKKQRRAVGHADPLEHLIPSSSDGEPAEPVAEAGQPDLSPQDTSTTNPPPGPTIVSSDSAIEAPASIATTEPQAPPTPLPKPSRKKVRATFHLSEELWNYVRDAVYALSGPGTEMTMTLFADQAIRSELARLEQRHNNGERFPTRAELRARLTATGE